MTTWCGKVVQKSEKRRDQEKNWTVNLAFASCEECEAKRRANSRYFTFGTGQLTESAPENWTDGPTPI